ncbi:DoxX family protein [Williamsia herbipolensis]|uniref:DoxX family protein n=1 Tax=Williamsia herbipolensis TaxID=1603258 RepID=UPI0005F78F3C|nr:DoxX family protein [Williamsia herbipolensis]MCX6471279.1 DoxX family protein [Mycobacteriales bacterium]
MFITAVILSVVLALVSLGAGAPKALLKGPAVEQLSGRGLSASLIRFIGGAEVAGAAGLLIGLAWHPLGIAAAIGLLIVFIGATVFHARNGDYANSETRGASLPSVVLAIVSLAVIITLAAA